MYRISYFLWHQWCKILLNKWMLVGALFSAYLLPIDLYWRRLVLNERILPFFTIYNLLSYTAIQCFASGWLSEIKRISIHAFYSIRCFIDQNMKRFEKNSSNEREKQSKYLIAPPKQLEIINSQFSCDWKEITSGN